MGAGPGGAYLFRLLQLERPSLDVSVFDVIPHTKCGIKPCAWGVSWPMFAKLCVGIDLSPDLYVLSRHQQVLLNGRRVKSNVAFVDKPRLLKEMLKGAAVSEPLPIYCDAYDRLIDATGVSRAYLSARPELPLWATIQTEIEVNSPPEPEIWFSPGGGYSWRFPIGEKGAPVGAGSPLGREIAEKEMTRILQEMGSVHAICRCSGRLQCRGLLEPFIEGNIWGLGEAIGLVDPATGAGITMAMHSARLMANHWDDPKAYQRSLKTTYSYLAHEVRVLDKMARDDKPTMGDLVRVGRAFGVNGIKPSLSDIRDLAVDYLRLQHRR